MGRLEKMILKENRIHKEREREREKTDRWEARWHTGMSSVSGSEGLPF